MPLIRLGGHGENYAAVIGCYKIGLEAGYSAIPITRLENSSDVYRRTSPELLSFSHKDV